MQAERKEAHQRVRAKLSRFRGALNALPSPIQRDHIIDSVSSDFDILRDFPRLVPQMLNASSLPPSSEPAYSPASSSRFKNHGCEDGWSENDPERVMEEGHCHGSDRGDVSSSAMCGNDLNPASSQLVKASSSETEISDHEPEASQASVGGRGPAATPAAGNNLKSTCT